MKHHVLFLIGIVFGRKIFFPLGLILQHIAHRMMGIGNYENLSVSGEKWILEYIAQNTKNDDAQRDFVFVDVGAGATSAHTDILLRLFGSGLQAHLFEPMPASFSQLQKKFSRQKNVICHNLAVGKQNGTVTLWDKNEENTHHATTQNEALSKNQKSISHKIQQIELQSFFKEHSLAPDFLKIDVEGYDFFVLQGLGDSLTDIPFIQFEFNSMHAFAGVQFKDFFDLLTPNYRLYRIYQDGLLEITEYNPLYQEIFEFQNILAIRR